MTHLNQIYAHYQTANCYQSILELLNWDQETMMPEDAIHHRSNQIEFLSNLQHRHNTNPDYYKQLLTAHSEFMGLNDCLDKLAINECLSDFKKTNKLPAEFIEKWSKTTSEAPSIWIKAKEANNFKLFEPTLELIIELCRQKANYLGYEQHPYDALVDEFEPGMTCSKIDTLFAPLYHEIGNIFKKTNTSIIELHGTYSHQSQLDFAQELLKTLDFSFSKGRLDVSSHPFSTTFSNTDTRITTRIQPNNPFSSMLSILHEMGHSFYDVGILNTKLPPPLQEPASFAVHESQSRWWETLIGMSLPFCKFVQPILKKHFKDPFFDSPTSIYNFINKVQASFIRTESDELTYSLHILLRYELEKALIDGSLKVSDIPHVWNKRMQDLLGITPPNDSLGCLQDIHWACGSFGYFPSYAIGNMMACQLFDKFEKEIPDWEQNVSSGNFKFIKQWLDENIYQHGRCLKPLKLIEISTGSSLTSEFYLNYLKKKFCKNSC